MRITCVYNEKDFTKYVEKIKDAECEEIAKMFSIQGSGQMMNALMNVT